MQLSNVATMPLTEAFIDNIQHNYLVVDKERQLHWCLKQQNVSNYIPFNLVITLYLHLGITMLHFWSVVNLNLL